MEVLRVVTINLWGEQPPWQRRMELLEAGLRALGADVVCMQEVRSVPNEVPNQAETLARALDYHHVFAVTTPWGGGDEGLAILSRAPITRHEAVELPYATEKERRICLGAAIQTEQGELAVFTTHLNWRMSDGMRREAQVCAVDRFVSEWQSTLPKVLTGDFNATPHHDEIRFLRGQHTLEGRRAVYQDAWERHHPVEPGFTWASSNPFTQRMRFLEIDRRLDYIFVTPTQRDGRGYIHAARLAFEHPAADGCYASDHYGVYAEVQIAPMP